MTTFQCAVLYGSVLILVALYLVCRIRLRFTARGAFLCMFLVFFGVPHVFDEQLLPAFYLAQLTPIVYERITLALALMWLGVIAGMELVALLARRQTACANRVAAHWHQEPFPRQTRTDRTVTIAIWVAVAFMAVMTVYENPIAKLQEFIALVGDTDRIAELRFKAGGSQVYAYNVVIASVGPFLSFVTVLRAMRRHRATSWFLAAITVTLVALGKVGLLNRSSLPLYVIQLALVPLIARRLRIRARHGIIAIGLAAVLVYPFFYHYLAVGPRDFLQIYFWNRTLLAPYFGMPNYFATFPDQVPFAMGRNFALINALFYHDPKYVPAMMLFAQKAGNFQGAYNAMFVAEAWADFGFYGVAIASLVLGACLAVADLWIFARGKTIEGAAAIVGVMYGLIVLSSTALQTALFSGGIMLVPAVCFLLHSIRLPRISFRWTAAEATSS